MTKADAGQYECQVSAERKLSLRYNLEVIVPIRLYVTCLQSKSTGSFKNNAPTLKMLIIQNS